MGFTLRAALDELPRARPGRRSPRSSRRSSAGVAARSPASPGRPSTIRGSRSPWGTSRRLIAEAARPDAERFDAIVLDLYEGPRTATQAREDPFWGPAALRRTREALAPGGVFSVWSEDPDAAFEKRLAAAGFRVERRRPESGGPRHAVYLAEALTPR